MKDIILPLTESTRLRIFVDGNKLHIGKEKLLDLAYDRDGNKLTEDYWEPDAQHEYSDCTITIQMNELNKFLENMNRLEKLLVLK